MGIGADSLDCDDGKWTFLKALLEESQHYEGVSPQFQEFVRVERVQFMWYKEHYQDCVEGFFSLLLYASMYIEPKGDIVSLATRTGRMLNPLALKHGHMTWPTFGLLDTLDLRPTKNGVPVAAMNTTPKYAYEWPATPILSPLLRSSPLSLLDRYEGNCTVIDVGVFDGTDWAAKSVERGCFTIGFEPVQKNRRLLKERSGISRDLYHILNVVPGRDAPNNTEYDAIPSSCRNPPQGYLLLIAAAAGDIAHAVKLQTRYDYTSLTDQGYLSGPADMETEEVAVVRIDDILRSHASVNASKIDILKLDAEGYEMGALRGAENLLRRTAVHYIVLEYHPAMLATSGTDHLQLLYFLNHYGFQCYSLKIGHEPIGFDAFAARYTRGDRLKLRGMGSLEDLICENIHWET